MGKKLKITVELCDEETGEVLETKSIFPESLPGAEAFDFSSRAGVLDPIDTYEKALLQTSQSAICSAAEELAKDMASKKNEIVEKVRFVEVDGLIGRFKIPVTGELFETLNSRERITTYTLTELMVQFNAGSSYRANVRNLNAVLQRNPDEQLALKTVQEYMIRLGNIADKKIETFVNGTLIDYRFDPESDNFLPSNIDDLPEEIRTGCAETLSTDDPILVSKINEYNKGKPEDKQIALDRLEEFLAGTEISSKYGLYASIDDVCSHAQKTTHEKEADSVSNVNPAEKVAKKDQNPENLEHFYAEYAEASDCEATKEEAEVADEADKCGEAAAKKKEVNKGSKGKNKGKKPRNNRAKKRNYVWHTTGEIIDGKTGKIYRFHGQGKKNVLRQMLACMLTNHLLENRYLVFNTDGAEDIRLCIDQCFSFHPHKIILDWHHVVTKTSQYVSLAFGGKIEEKRHIRKNIFSLLWVGEVQKAIIYIKSIDASMVRNQERFDDLIGYVERKKPYLPCYALRHILGLKNSSQSVEKTNDLVVSSRQKHNGMSWSWCGSNSIATLRTLELNGELDSFLRTGSISFTLVEPSKKHKPEKQKFAA